MPDKFVGEHPADVDEGKGARGVLEDGTVALGERVLYVVLRALAYLGDVRVQTDPEALVAEPPGDLGEEFTL